jgi:DNA-binding PadR family transcriptional regulator
MPPEGRRRKYYALTDDGHAALAVHKRQWATVLRALGEVWGGADVRPLALRGV